MVYILEKNWEVYFNKFVPGHRYEHNPITILLCLSKLNKPITILHIWRNSPIKTSSSHQYTRVETY